MSRTAGATLAELLQLSWSEFQPIAALYCLPAILGCIVLGLVLGQPLPGLVASTGALAAGFAFFQPAFRDPRIPILAVAIGASLSAAIGTLANAWLPADIVCAGLWGTGLGLMNMVDPGFGWLALQGGIALIIAASFPATPEYAALRLVLVFAGAVVQGAIVLSLHRLMPGHFHSVTHQQGRTVRGVLQETADILAGHLPGRNYAFALGAGVALGDLLVRLIDLPNGYWVPLTVMLVMRPAARETSSRAVARLVGTIAGAALVTLLMAVLRPSPPWIIVLIGAATWGCFALQRVNFAALSFCITAYVVLLFALMGLPEPMVALDRTIATALGGAIAVLAHWACRWLSRPRVRSASA